MTERYIFRCKKCGYSYMAIAFLPSVAVKKERFCEVCELDGHGKVAMVIEPVEE